MTALTAPAAAGPRRASITYFAVAAALVLAWFATALRWHASLTVTLLPPLLLLLAALIDHGRIMWRARPVAFEVRDGAFVAPTAARLLTAAAVTTLSGGATLTGLFLWPMSPDIPRVLLTTGRVCAVILVILTVLRLVVLRPGTGRVQLRPEGLRITYAYGGREVPWEAVSTGPQRQGSMVEPSIRIGRPELVRSTGLARRRSKTAHLPASESWIRREFLLDAVNYYLATPAARGTIGTDEGYTHLRRVLRAG